MAFSLFSVVSLSVIYRLTINFPELPYTNELKNVESDEFVKTSGLIVGDIHRLLEDLKVDGKHLARVSDYRYHNVIGTLVNIDIYFEKENPLVSDIILSAIKNGHIGDLKVSDEGFELHVVRDSETSCAATEFTCLDKTCIPADQRCDGRRDCPDGSDEHRHHGKCKQHQPIIHQSQKVVFAPRHETVHLSSTVENSDKDTVIAWSRGDVLLGVGQVTVIEDERIKVYQKGEKHYLMINNVTNSDDGSYKMVIQGMNVEADFEIRVTSDYLPNETDDCPSGQRACKSGHCIPVAEFCDRHVQCPDGDDEFDCSEVQCKFNEFQCENTRICVPKVVVCDGWRDCHDGSDEKNCTSSKKIYKPHHHKAKLNVLCHDGSEPEFSLHGSSYCWSNSVCPKSSECVHGLCCPLSKTGKRSTGNTAIECKEGEFRCNTGECFPEEKKCNRKYDCSDGSDEITCDYYIAVQKYHREQQQQKQEEPVEEARKSVESVEAAHDDDELVCSDQEFRCPYLPTTKCFHYDKLCDGVDDCGDGSDEGNCDSNELSAPTTTTTTQAPVHQQHHHAQQQPHQQPQQPQQVGRCSAAQFECKRDSKCIDKQLECNRKYDCDDGSDETECEYFRSAMARRESATTTTTQTSQQSHPAQQHQQVHQAQPAQQTHHQHQQQQEAESRRIADEEHRRRTEEYHRQQQLRQQQQQASNYETSSEVTFQDEYVADDNADGCLENEFQCAIGECIDKRRVCDTRPDCLDASDERNCADRAPSHLPPPQPHHPPHNDVDDYDEDQVPQQQQPDQQPVDIQITVFPSEKEVREGRDISFDCRARTSDNSAYPSTSWTREGGALPPSAHDSGSRLTINPVALSDAGTYICVATHNGQTVEAKAVLTVVTYGPQGVSNGLRATGQCTSEEKQCGDGSCVKNEFICDGERDCSDGSDEQNCPSSSASRSCEPNEFKCNNNKCVQKMWLCDGDDDCGDNSDEMNCSAKQANGKCKATDFQCLDKGCVPSSFHCDGTNDCNDGSDEVGCVQPTVVNPPQTNLQVPRGDTFSLTCKAVAVPAPYINWRLNWGPVCEPPRCLQTSEGGFGTLTIHDAQPVDQGAYTCEAINVKGRVLATPDCIVRVVEQPFPTRPPPPPTPPAQIARCDTTGSVSPYPNSYGQCECKPQVTGPNCDQCRPGSFHLSPKSPEGCLKCFCFGITQTCKSSGWYRTKDRLMFAGDSEGVTLSDVEERTIDRQASYSYFKTGYLTFEGTTDGVSKYWRLPQRFLGDKVTSYGGKMEFEIEFSGSGPHSSEPMVVLKGNQNILVHRVRNQEQVLRSDSPVRITVETYETNYEQMNGAPATREDLLMVLADLDAFLIRATHVNQQTSTSLGDVSWEIAVDRQTQDGLALEVEQCSCPPGYIGTSCEDCAPGYERSGHGPYLGTCVPQQRQQQCGPGAVAPTSTGQCQCKAAVTGPNCDRCAPNAFGLAPSNPQGCIPCFCSGVTQQCSASNYRRTVVSIDYSRGDRDQLELTSADSRQPFSPQTHAEVTGQQIEFRSFNEARGQTLYWKLPEKFLGNKVTAYGGSLKYTFRFSGNGNADNGADVILKGNDIALQYKSRQPIHPDRENTIEIQLFENHWQRVDGQPATREHLLMTLADLDTLLIKASYNDDCTDSSLLSVNFEFAEPHGRGLTAAEVEQCMCPPGYVGTSCEDCAPGYSRTGGGLYLGLCEKCECNGHASQCDKEYGYCLDCQHNTEGDQCERCKPGFIGDARRGTPQDCQPAATRAPCHCNNHSPRGCDSFGRCLLCEHSTEGTQCERCKKGYYGDATKGTPFDCTPCPCPGASDCYLDSEGQVACRICPAGLQGRLCNECAPGYTRSNKPAGRVCEPIGQVNPGDITFVPKPNEVGRPPQPVIDPPHLVVDEGDAAQFRCYVPGIPDCQITWHREVYGGTLPHGVYQTGNALKIPQAQMHHAGKYICSAANIYGIGESTPAVLEVKRRNIQPKVDPPRQTVERDQPARFKCWVPGNSAVTLKWTRADGSPLPRGAQEKQGILHIGRTTEQEIGQYKCTATDPSDNIPRVSEPVDLAIRDPEPAATPQVDPPVQTVNVNDPAQFRCWVAGQPRAQLKWARKDGRPLPQGIMERDGYLRIDRSQINDAGDYECSYTPANGGPPVPAPLARLNVNQPLRPIIEPNEQTIPEGSPFRIRCYVPGHPRIQLTFRKATGSLNPDNDQQDGVLSVARAEKSDQGDYICTARDPTTGQPVDSGPATVHVTPASTPPQLETRPLMPIIRPSEQTVREGDPVTIECEVEGNPLAGQYLSFERLDQRPLPFGSSDSSGVLTIPSAVLSDAGDYVCIYRPENRSPARTSPSVLKVTRAGTPPKPVATPPLLRIAPNEQAKFHCEPNSDTPARIKWFHTTDKNPLPEGVTPDGEDLIVSEANDYTIGEYVCTAENDYGTGESNPVRLEVTDVQEPPTAEVQPRTWNGNPGERHQFLCHVTGSPTPKITWTGPNGAPLPHDVSALEPNILDFSNGRSELNGNYTCTASNPIGEASDVGVVNIGPSLTIKTNPSGPKLIVTVGEPVNIKCEAFGAPGEKEPEVEWLHDPGPERGDLPDDFKPVTISEQFIRHPSIGLGNAGLYVCKGTSEHATATKNIIIEVVEPSRVATVSILGGSKQEFSAGRSGELVCTATGNSLIDRLEWTRPDGQLPAEVEDHNENGLLHFADFSNGQAGEYTCNGYRNNVLIASATVEVLSESQSQDEEVVINEKPNVRVVNQGDSLVLKCSSSEFENGENYKWALLRDGSLVRQLGSEPTLEINKVNPSNDYGVYRCNVEDNNGHVGGSAYTAVAVGYDQSNSVDVKFEEKSDAILTCPVFLVPGSKVEWSYSDGDLPANAHPNGNKIEIKGFDDTTSGIYICRVSIDSNHISGYVNAQILVPDTIIQVLLEVSSESPQIGERAWFDCKVTGDPTAVITWNRESTTEELPPSAQVTGGRLLFTGLKEEDAGIYKCVAKTKAGSLQTRTVLNIGSGKRKRKHLGNRRAAGRRLLRHRRRNASQLSARPQQRKIRKLIGSWF